MRGMLFVLALLAAGCRKPAAPPAVSSGSTGLDRTLAERLLRTNPQEKMTALDFEWFDQSDPSALRQALRRTGCEEFEGRVSCLARRRFRFETGGTSMIVWELRDRSRPLPEWDAWLIQLKEKDAGPLFYGVTALEPVRGATVLLTLKDGQWAGYLKAYMPEILNRRIRKDDAP